MGFHKKNNFLIFAFLPVLFFIGCTAQIPTPPINIPAVNPVNRIETSTQQTQTTAGEQTQQTGALPPTIALPLTDSLSRITKKPFGIYITPKSSPVQPEHFTGYHTGTDFEIFPVELDKYVPVSAICTGKIEVKRTAQGYGGVLVESCDLDNQPVTVVYGHLKLTSINQNVGDTLTAGESFALLGNAYSTETGGERKHLPLGIKKGSTVNLLGYVQNESDLSGWLDFQKLL